MPAGGLVMQRAHFTDLFVDRLPFLDEILFELFDAPQFTYTEVFNIRNSTRAYEEITGITGFGLFPSKGEGEGVEYDSLLQAFDKRFAHTTYAKGFQISMEAMDDDIDGAITNAAPALARIAKNSIETNAFADFNNGLPGGTVTTPDGVTFFNNSHVLRGGGTFDNYLNADFDQGSLEEVINIFDDTRDERGQFVDLSAAILLHPPALKWRINEVLKSQLRSDTAENAINVVNQLGIRPIECKYLTEANDWFVGAAPSTHRLMFYWRTEPTTDHGLDFDTGNMKTKMTYRNSHGPADWRGWVGCEGL